MKSAADHVDLSEVSSCSVALRDAAAHVCWGRSTGWTEVGLGGVLADSQLRRSCFLPTGNRRERAVVTAKVKA
jgi:hypothetical protein